MAIPDHQALIEPVLELASNGETFVPLAESEIAALFTELMIEHGVGVRSSRVLEFIVSMKISSQTTNKLPLQSSYPAY